jgi:hypothetical protein
VDHLVVADRQDEVLAVGVHQREGQLVVVVLPVDRVQFRVAQASFIHPMFHLNPKPSPPVEVGCGDTPAHEVDSSAMVTTPGVRLYAVALASCSNCHRVEVLPAAVDWLGIHSPGCAGVVEVEHRGDRVDPQAVDVELLQPVGRVGDEEVAHLGAAEVEDERAPLLVPAACAGPGARRGPPSNLAKRPRRRSRSAWHPVEDDADPVAVQVVHEQPELVGRAPGEDTA